MKDCPCEQQPNRAHRSEGFIFVILSLPTFDLLLVLCEGVRTVVICGPHVCLQCDAV